MLLICPHAGYKDTHERLDCNIGDVTGFKSSSFWYLEPLTVFAQI